MKFLKCKTTCFIAFESYWFIKLVIPELYSYTVHTKIYIYVVLILLNKQFKSIQLISCGSTLYNVAIKLKIQITFYRYHNLLLHNINTHSFTLIVYINCAFNIAFNYTSLLNPVSRVLEINLVEKLKRILDFLIQNGLIFK